MSNLKIHDTATVDPNAYLGEGTKVWNYSQVREGATIGRDVTIGSHVYVDQGVSIGSRCKIENGAKLYYPAMIGDGVFIGPGVMLLNDPHPRAVDERGHKLEESDWISLGVTIHNFASVGAGAIIMPGVTIGMNAMIGSGAVVTRDVPPGATVVGVPARMMGDTIMESVKP